MKLHGSAHIFRNDRDEQGRPAGGMFQATGIDIRYQDGPLNGGPATGAFVEDVITAAIRRIEFYQESEFSCRENALAITKLEEALMWLHRRTMRRTEEGVEGTHELDSAARSRPNFLKAKLREQLAVGRVPDEVGIEVVRAARDFALPVQQADVRLDAATDAWCFGRSVSYVKGESWVPVTVDDESWPFVDGDLLVSKSTGCIYRVDGTELELVAEAGGAHGSEVGTRKPLSLYNGTTFDLYQSAVGRVPLRPAGSED